MSETWDLVTRFVLGGAVVASFSARGVFNPKSFSGTSRQHPRWRSFAVALISWSILTRLKMLDRHGATLGLLAAAAALFAVAFLLWFLVYGRRGRGAMQPRVK